MGEPGENVGLAAAVIGLLKELAGRVVVRAGLLIPTKLALEVAEPA